MTKLEKTIDTIFTLFDDMIKGSTKKKVPFSEVVDLIDTQVSLLNALIDEDITKASELARKRFLPLLKYLITTDDDIDRQLIYQTATKEAYRISAQRDFESFVIYYEWEKSEEEKFYAPRVEILQGFAYYLNKMVFDPHFEGIIGNLPSGWGKTYLVTLANAFSYGVDSAGAILALCSNEDVVNAGSLTVKEIMRSEEFGEVFPHMRWSKEDKDYYKKDSESIWKLRDCKLQASYFAKTTRSDVVGCRASKWVWIDDLYADYKEALNENDNKYYYNKFLTVWRKRFVQEAPVWKFIITGTMWAPTDFIVKIIDWLKGQYTFIPHPHFKYVRVSDDGRFAIIQVPALDIVTGKSTCEALASTRTILNERASLDRYIFECNFQQNPISPEAMAFDWKNLKIYKNQLDNDYGSTWAVIDGTRKSGKDFFSMPILQPYMNDYALIDCIYTQTATSKLTDQICDMIMKHNVTNLIVESNVDGGLKKIIEKELDRRNFHNGIIINEHYSTMVKQTRIELERGNLTERIWYPSQDLFPINSDMGRFMESHTMYNIEGGNRHDDATDSLAMFTADIVTGKNKPIKPVIFKRLF